MKEIKNYAIIILLLSVACGGSDASNNSDTSNKNDKEMGGNDAGAILIKNASAIISGTERSCESNNDTELDCKAYNITFILENTHDNLSIERVNLIKIKIDKDLEVEHPIICTNHPWNVSPKDDSGVLEIKYGYNATIFSGNTPTLSYQCGSRNDFLRDDINPEPFSAGIEAGSIKLTLSGIMSNAETWKVETDIEL